MQITFREKERTYWESWLPEDLSARLDKIKEGVKSLNDRFEYKKQVPHFTPHSIAHCKGVENNIHRLIPEDLHKKLSVAEKFFLLASAWLHDIGMLKGLFTEDDGLTDDKIRDDHHTRTARYIVEEFSTLGVKEYEAETFSILCKYHRRRCNIELCPQYLSVAEHGTMRMQLLASYLRIADALHNDQTRVDGKLYAISLTYDIPLKQKLHWLRSKFIIGIGYDTDNKELVIHFKYPEREGDFKLKPDRPFSETFDKIYRLIIQDLEDELSSVKNVLFKSNISFFLKVSHQVHLVEFNEQFLKDIKSVFNYYHLLDNPSSSALLMLVLESMEGIIEAHSSNSETGDTIKTNITSFLDEVGENILETRKCHTGLVNLVNNIRRRINEGNVEELSIWLKGYKKKLTVKRRLLRHYASIYFSEYIERNDKKANETYNIVLYGYSELVLKTICGFRDALLVKRLHELPSELDEDVLASKILSLSDCIKNLDESSDNCLDTLKTNLKKIDELQCQLKLYHEQNIEKLVSEKFRFFCCEGQPKNHTAWGGRVLYHDGKQYSLALKECGFTNIHIIPDATATSMIVPFEKDEAFPAADFVMVGTNGYNEDSFKHSAGHSMVVAAKCFAAEVVKLELEVQKRKPPELILSLMTDKYEKVGGKRDPESVGKRPQDKCGRQHEKEMTNIGGWTFRNAFANESVRKHSFYSQDPIFQRELHMVNEYVSFYNPREDRIPRRYVDVTISEMGFCFNDDPKDFWQTGAQITGQAQALDQNNEDHVKADNNVAE